jgi:iron complex outermembrane receptor protein
LLQILKALLLFFFLSIVSLAAGQPGSSCDFQITGKIVDNEGKPLRGASIFIPALNRGSTSDPLGVFVFTKICAGIITVEVSFVGYRKLLQKVRVKGSGAVEFRLLPEETVLNEVVISDHYDHISNTQTTSALSGSALDAVRGESFGKTLRSIAGVNTLQAGPAIFKPVIHGVHGQRILILNNGLRHEGQQWGAEHAPEIDPYLASNIVVIKDASAIKYGTDALGGVVIVNPAELPSKPGMGGTANLALQSNGRGGSFSTLLEGASKKIDGLRWRTHGTFKKLGDFSAANYMLTNTGVEELNFSAALGYHKSENAGYELFYSHFSTQLGILRGSSISTPEDLSEAFKRTKPLFTSGFSYDINSPRQEVTHDLLKANAHFHRGVNTFTFQYGLQKNDRKEFDVRRGSLTDIPAIDLTLYTHTLDIEWERESPSKGIRCLGINGLVQNNDNNPGTQRLPFIPNFNTYSGGLYGNQKVTLNKWEAEAGIRFDYRYYTVAGRDFSNQVYRDELTFANFSGILGATKTLTSKSSIITGISTAWRPPHVSELYSIGTHQSAAAIEYGLLLDEETTRVVDIDTYDFKNEQALKWVSTYKYQTENTVLDLTAYYSYIYNFIFLQPEGVTRDIRGVFPYYRYRQTDASFSGLDARLEQKIAAAFTVTLKTSWLWMKDAIKNDFFVFIPAQRGEINLRYERDISPGFTNFFVEANVQGVARQYRTPARIISPEELQEASRNGVNLFENDDRNFDFAAAPNAYALVSAQLGTDILSKSSKLTIRLGSENLLNTTYREYTNRLRYFSDDVGRNVSLSIKCSF